MALPSKTAGTRKPILPHSFQYDVIVIGGGSGGLAAAREVAALGGKVLLFDYVRPSAHGTKWGIGGTCVNVGCIPKKLMHHAALLGQGLHDAAEFGWRVGLGGEGTVDGGGSSGGHDWAAMVGNIHGYIKGTNWGYKNSLKSEHVEYQNALARVVDPHTVEFPGKAAGGSGSVARATAAHIIVAVGGRPRYPADLPGAEHAITSDDLFWLKASPGRTLLVGGGYVALECAGFLTHLGCPATVMVRGQALRGFDQEMAEKIVTHMAATGTTFLRGCAPSRIEKLPGGESGSRRDAFRVTWTSETGATDSAVFDTVVMATGRAPETQDLGLDTVGVTLDPSGKVIGHRGGVAPGAAVAAARGGSGGSFTVGAALQQTLPPSAFAETSSVPSIHAVGDVLAGAPELTPVAIRAGKLLAHRIMGGHIPTGGGDADATAAASATPDHLVMRYNMIPTTIFTPLEYGCVGLSEGEAVRQFGAANVETFHLAYDTLELGVSHRMGTDGMPLPPQCYTKLVVHKDTDRVVGLHVLGPDAGDVVQGFAVALRLGATKAHFDATVGIHPTHAEEVVQLDRTKSSGVPFVKTSC